MHFTTKKTFSKVYHTRMAMIEFWFVLLCLFYLRFGVGEWTFPAVIRA